MKIEIDQVRDIINELYHLSQNFKNEISPTYSFRQCNAYNKDQIKSALRHFANSLDTQFMLIDKKLKQEKEDV